jgi:hypothetical protein
MVTGIGARQCSNPANMTVLSQFVCAELIKTTFWPHSVRSRVIAGVEIIGYSPFSVSPETRVANAWRGAQV